MNITTPYGTFSSPEEYERHIETAVDVFWQLQADEEAKKETQEEEERSTHHATENR